MAGRLAKRPLCCSLLRTVDVDTNLLELAARENLSSDEVAVLFLRAHNDIYL